MAKSTLAEKTSALAQMIKKSGLLGKKAEQEIKHTEPTEQNNLGAEMQQVVNEQPGNQASNPAEVPPPVNDKVRQEPGVQDLNKSPEEALAATGTQVNNIAVDGTPSGTPAQQAKTASDYQNELASILKQIKQRKTAAAQPAVPAEVPEIVSANEVLEKLAAAKTQQDQREASALFAKFASTNPVFETARASAMQERMLSDINNLSLAKDISHKQAAEELDAALAADPEAAAELSDDVNGAALADLAQGEQATASLLNDIGAMADGASQILGVEVTPEALVDAADKVAEMADEMGVPPEALLASAIQQMTGGAAPEIEGNTPEELQAAQQIMDEAAQQGISPDEVIEMAAAQLAGGEGAPAEPPAAEPPAAEPAAQPAESEPPAENKENKPAEQPKDEEGAEKAAALQKLSSTRLGRIALGI
jgi:hypothetical protein